jgi:hypothetical protein
LASVPSFETDTFGVQARRITDLVKFLGNSIHNETFEGAARFYSITVIVRNKIVEVKDEVVALLS